MSVTTDGTTGIDKIAAGKIVADDFEAALFFASKTGNGYQKLPSGLIIQWGIVVNTNNIGSGYSYVSFPLPFTTAVYTVQLSAITGAPNYHMFTSCVENGSVSLAGFNYVNYLNTNLPNGVPLSAITHWLAIGY